MQVPVPVPQPVAPELVADCQPAPAAGTTVGDALNLLEDTQHCLAVMRANAKALRDAEPKVHP